MMKTFSRCLALVAALAFGVAALGASAQDARSSSAEPTVAQIYQAASTGDLDRANAMVDEVLKAHPNSAKAHYVKAEVSARSGKSEVAKQELATAEQLAPGLPFAKAEAVQQLRNQLSNTGSTASNARPATAPAANTRQMGAPADSGREAAAPAARSGLPWGTILLVGGLALIAFAFMRRRRAAQAEVGGAAAAMTGGPAQYGQYGPNYGPQGGVPPAGYGPGPGYPQQPSMGSSLARGVGTGLAMGAGMLAAEEIGHRMFGHGGAQAGAYNPNSGNANTPSLDQIDDGMRRNLNSDMGGADFGTNDAGWDDAGGGGDSSGSDVGGGDW